MAHFRAVVRGGRSAASRLGHKSTGIETLLQTWGYDVRVSAWYNEAKDEDHAVVELVHHSTGEKLQLAYLNLTAGKVED